jgi:crossover junction endodeoxyribonuclease RuvC
MIILGIDPGTTIIGFGVIKKEGQGFACLEYGVIRNPGKDRAADFTNTVSILSSIIKKHHPTAAAIEKLFFANNQKTAMAVSEMRGVLLLTLANHRLPVHEFTPLQVKQMVSRYGGADKKQMQKIVRLILRIPEEIKPDDAADALAIALCGAAAQ